MQPRAVEETSHAALPLGAAVQPRPPTLSWQVHFNTAIQFLPLSSLMYNLEQSSLGAARAGTRKMPPASLSIKKQAAEHPLLCQLLRRHTTACRSCSESPSSSASWAQYLLRLHVRWMTGKRATAASRSGCGGRAPQKRGAHCVSGHLQLGAWDSCACVCVRPGGERGPVVAPMDNHLLHFMW